MPHLEHGMGSATPNRVFLLLLGQKQSPLRACYRSATALLPALVAEHRIDIVRENRHF